MEGNRTQINIYMQGPTLLEQDSPHSQCHTREPKQSAATAGPA